MITNDREYRAFQVSGQEEREYTVEGYACVFEQETVLYEERGIEYKEIVDRNAFSNTAMADVVLNYNHKGKPVARTKNGTLELTIDDHGLKVNAYLGGTEEGRRMYEEVKGGYLDKMSFAFIVDGDQYNNETHTRRITSIKRLFDTAIVDIPAYEQTSVSARSFFEAEAEKEMAEALEREKREALIAEIRAIAKGEKHGTV